MTVGAPQMRDTQDVYRTIEYDRWSQRAGFDQDEHYLISHYLDRDRKTLEAGTGGGRILLAMKEMGFSSLHGFDFVPEFIDQARRRDPEAAIGSTFRTPRSSCMPPPASTNSSTSNN